MVQVVLFKTHLWNLDIENFAIKIMSEAKNNNTNFFILMHDDDGKIYESINEPLKNLTIKFSEDDIRTLYQSGFYNMWLSNHWILMWFFKKFSDYDYYWSIEYDVRIVGDSRTIWQYSGSEDFIYPRGNYASPQNPYFNHYIGKIITDTKKRQGALQLARYSKKFLEYLHQNFIAGENGQDELIIFSLANHGNFRMSSNFLGELIQGYWTWDPQFITQNTRQYQKLLKIINHVSTKSVYILHPIK